MNEIDGNNGSSPPLGYLLITSEISVSIIRKKRARRLRARFLFTESAPHQADVHMLPQASLSTEAGAKKSGHSTEAGMKNGHPENEGEGTPRRYTELEGNYKNFALIQWLKKEKPFIAFRSKYLYTRGIVTLDRICFLIP